MLSKQKYHDVHHQHINPRQEVTTFINSHHLHLQPYDNYVKIKIVNVQIGMNHSKMFKNLKDGNMISLEDTKR